MFYDTTDRRRISAAKPGIAIRWLGSLGLVMASTIVGLLLLELGCRLARGPEALTSLRNLVLASRIHPDRDAIGRLMPPSYEYEPTLGFFNPPDYHTSALTFDSQGFRSMPPLVANAVPAPPILATGDSYTMGDEAADTESWPAQLQTVLGWRTLNAGVSGYGLDQTVLLSERLATRLKPAALVVGFIADDVRRAEMSRMWGREKSYFELAGGELVLRNVPVPQTRDPREALTPLQRAFGWSVLLDTVLDRLRLRNRWYADEIRALPAGAGERLACPLMRRLSALGVPTLVVAQYLPSAWDSAASGAEEHRIARVVLDCAGQAGLATLDLYGTIGDAVHAGGRDAVYAQWHPNRQGYRLIGEAVAAELQRRNMPAR